MLPVLPLADVIQEVGATAIPPFSLRLMGKSLITVSFFGLVTLGVACRAALRASRGQGADRTKARAKTDGILFWGAFTFGVGILHTLIGLTMTALSVRAAGTLQPDAHWLVATGIAASLLSSGYGLFVLVLAALVWFGFRTWYAKSEG